jgi:hypothetical protein
MIDNLPCFKQVFKAGFFGGLQFKRVRAYITKPLSVTTSILNFCQIHYEG